MSSDNADKRPDVNDLWRTGVHWTEIPVEVLDPGPAADLGGLDFSGPDAATLEQLRCNDDDRALSTFDNACRVLELDPRWRRRLWRCRFRLQPMLDAEPCSDIHDLRIRRFLEVEYGIRISTATAHEAINLVSHNNARHPVCEYLEGLEWDGVHRLGAMLPDLFGVEPSELVAAYGRRWMISAVARVFDPGCKVDTMLILVGEQGAKKSTGLRALVGADWFSDTPLDVGNKDAYQGLQGVWVCEWAEMESARRGKEQTTIKAFLASQVDRYRPSYGRRMIQAQRQTVFVGTTNTRDFLKDPTGDRRYWCVEVADDIDPKSIAAVRDQLWAEAFYLYERGEQWWLTPEEMEQQRGANEPFRDVDTWEADLHEWLEDEEARVPGPVEVRSERLMQDVLGIAPERSRGKPGKVATAVLRERGYVKQRASRADVNGRRPRVWVLNR